jgi:hypothetical protein
MARSCDKTCRVGEVTSTLAYSRQITSRSHSERSAYGISLVESVSGRVLPFAVADSGREENVSIARAHQGRGGSRPVGSLRAVTVNFLFRRVPADYRPGRYTEAMAMRGAPLKKPGPEQREKRREKFQ